MVTQLVVTVIVIAMNSGLLDGAVYAFDLAIGPVTLRLRTLL